jgi:hypothetical protein
MNASVNDSHPSTLEFDQLRAGLIDHLPAERARLIEHLAACDRCRSLASWDRVLGALNDATLESGALQSDLQKRRRAALAGRAARRPIRHAPRLAIAAALAAILVGAGVFLALPRPADTPGPALTRNGAVPDIYADLDFYLWLSRENEQSGDVPSTRG